MFLNRNDLDGGHTEVLAKYKGVSHQDKCRGMDAAVRCPVGKGVAVLCGTHPELRHEWLLGGLSASSVEQCGAACWQLPGAEGDAADMAMDRSWTPETIGTAISLNVSGNACMSNVAKMQSRGLAEVLAAEEAGRRAFWCMLLHACFR
jgi:hypothetical protein